MTGENVRRAIAELETEAEGLAADIVASDKKAAAALEEAGISNDLAQTAKDLATTAQSNASNALADASEAKAQAGQAFIDAKTAIGNAVTAQTDAQTAIDNAKTALSTAGSADSKAGQAIAKADAIPTTITGIIADKNLVNGSYVDTKVNDATGAWSKELVRVEGVIDGIEIGGRNLFVISEVPVRSNIEKSENKLTFINNYSNGTSIKIGSILEVGKEYTISFKVKLLSGDANSPGISGSIRFYDPLGESPMKQFGGRGAEYISETFVLDSISESYAIFFYASSTGVYEFKDIKIEKGNKATDWTPAPEDLYTQEEFKLFNAQYTQDVTGMTGRLTTVENGKLDGSTFQTFKQSEYQVTADKVTSTVERVDTAEGKITTQGTAISQNATAIASKADKTVVDKLSGTVTTQGTAISQNATDISSKAEQEEVNQIKGTVDTHTTEISQNATAITSKASQKEVDTVKGTVATHTSTLTQQAKDISARLTQSQVDNLVSDKGYSTVSYVDTEISATAGAIRTEMTAVEGKIPTEIGGRNLIVGNGKEFVNTSLGQWGAYAKSNLPWKVSLEEMGLKNGDHITFSAEFKDLTPQNTVAIRIDFNRDSGGYGYRIGESISEDGRYSLTATIPEDPDYTSISVRLFPRDPESADGYDYYIRHRYEKLEKGNVATDWSPAPEVTMMQNDFNVFKAEYDQSAQGWSSKLLQIENAGYATKTWSNQTFATPQSVSTQLTSYAKTTDLNGLVTETALENKNFITASAVNTLLSSYAKTTALNGMVTETSLANKNFATASSVSTQLQSYAKTTDLNGLATESYVGTQLSATAEGIRTEITAVEGKIPTAIGGVNLMKDTSEAVTNVPIYEFGNYNYFGSRSISSFGLKNGETITYSAKISGIPDGQGVALRMEWINDKGGYGGQVVGKSIYSDGIASVTFTIPDEIEYWGIRVRFMPANYTEPFTVGVSCEMLERGTVASDWRPTTQEYYDYANTTISTEVGKVEQLITAVKTNPKGTITGYNSLVNTVDSMNQTIGTNGGNIAQLVLTDSMFSTKVLEQVQVGGVNLVPNTNEEWRTVTIGQFGYYETFTTTPGYDGWYTITVDIKDVPAGRAIALRLDVPIQVMSKENITQDGTYTYSVKVNKEITASTTLRYRIMPVGDVWDYKVKIRRVKVEKGKIPTDWSPAPEDMATSKQVSSIEQKANSIQALVGTTNDSVARAVMTSSLWETEVSKVIDDELEQDYKTVTSRIDNVPRKDGLNYGTDTPSHRYYDYPLESTIVYGSTINVKFIMQGTSNTGQQVAIDHVNSSGALTRVYSTNLTAGESTVSITFKATQTLLSSGSKIRLKIYGYKSYAAYFEMWYTKSHQVPTDGSNTGAISSKITQSYNMINLSILGKEGALSRIAIGEEGIQIDGKLLHITAKTFIDNAVIKSAMIDTLDAGKITTGELNAKNIRVINLDANSISGNEASFVRALFSGVHSTLQITADGVNILDNIGRSSTFLDSSGIEFSRQGVNLGKLEYVNNITDSGDLNNMHGFSMRPNRNSYFGISYFKTAGATYSTRSFAVSGRTGNIYISGLIKPSEQQPYGLDITWGTITNVGTNVRIYNHDRTGGIQINNGDFSYLTSGGWRSLNGWLK